MIFYIAYQTQSKEKTINSYNRKQYFKVDCCFRSRTVSKFNELKKSHKYFLFNACDLCIQNNKDDYNFNFCNKCNKRLECIKNAV